MKNSNCKPIIGDDQSIGHDTVRMNHDASNMSWNTYKLSAIFLTK